MSESAVLEAPAPVTTEPVETPVSDSPVSETPATATEPTEPVETADTAEGEQQEGEGVTLTKQEAEAIAASLEMLKSFQEGGGKEAPIAPPENATEIAEQADAAEAAVKDLIPWQPMTPEAAESLGLYPEAAEALNERDRTLAANVVYAVEQRVQGVLKQAMELVNQANDRAEVAVLTHDLIRENPDYAEVIPQVRNAISQARAKNPAAKPDEVRAAVKTEMSKHLAGVSALKRLRGVQVEGAGRPGPSAPSAARQPAKVEKPISLQERVNQIMNGR